MAEFGSAPLEAEFKHNTSIGANGEILYERLTKSRIRQTSTILASHGMIVGRSTFTAAKRSRYISIKQRTVPLPITCGALWTRSTLVGLPASGA